MTNSAGRLLLCRAARMHVFTEVAETVATWCNYCNIVASHIHILCFKKVTNIGLYNAICCRWSKHSTQNYEALHSPLDRLSLSAWKISVASTAGFWVGRHDPAACCRLLQPFAFECELRGGAAHRCHWSGSLAALEGSRLPVETRVYWHRICPQERSGYDGRDVSRSRHFHHLPPPTS